MKIKNNSMYHLCTISPWPLIMSMNIMSMMTSMIKLINFKSTMMMIMVMMSMTMACYQWWRDMVRESTMQGMHTKMVMKMIKMTMILFILTEIMFFMSMFWSYLHMMLSPSIEIGSKWPPFYMNKMMVNPMKLPMMNTIILVSSGMTLTIAHMMFYKKNYNKTMMMMMMTLALSMMFTSIQIYEYKQSKFTMNNSNMGSTFFMLTGFHGLHVIIGTMFIITATKRISMSQMSNHHSMNLEMSAWYWHFVDVVWLVLFILIYWYPL